jgi:hypothetical protein
MKTTIFNCVIISNLLFGFNNCLKANDTLCITTSINYYIDLSDTFGGGSMFVGDITLSKSWYGLRMSFGYFQSQSKFLLKIPISEINSILEIPIDEMSIMQVVTLSGMIHPIQNKLIDLDVLVGASFNNSKSFFLKGVDFSYNLNDNKFSYFIKDYQLSKRKQIGYEIGLALTFKIFQRLGIQLNARIQDLNDIGSFFFIGSGLRFNIYK